MNDSEQQNAIAQACGWTQIEECTCHNRQLKGFEPNPGQHKKHTPDYLNDLNAMHEAEEVLSDVQRIHFSTQIMHSHNAKGGRGCTAFDYGHATARQRAEAFLKTLNLWKL